MDRRKNLLENYKRMTVNYERTSESAEVILQLSFCHPPLKKLHR